MSIDAYRGSNANSQFENKKMIKRNDHEKLKLSNSTAWVFLDIRGEKYVTIRQDQSAYPNRLNASDLTKLFNWLQSD